MEKNKFAVGRLLAIIGVVVLLGSVFLRNHFVGSYYEESCMGGCMTGLVVGIAMALVGALLMARADKLVWPFILAVLVVAALFVPITKKTDTGDYKYQSIVYSIEYNCDALQHYTKITKVFGFKLTEFPVR